MKNWQRMRLDEGRGFVSKRITSKLLAVHNLLYGNSFYINYGKFARIFHPREIIIVDDGYVVSSGG